MTHGEPAISMLPLAVEASFERLHFTLKMKVFLLSLVAASVCVFGAPVQYEVTGIVRRVDRSASEVVVRHEAVPGYMEPMVMPFKVKDKHSLEGISAGDKIKFQLHVTDEEDWIERIAVLGREAGGAKDDHLRHQDGVGLKTGGRVPDFRLLDAKGERVTRETYQGMAFAYTFVFTRCPLPSMCPLLNHKFREVQGLIEGSKCRLLSVSIDPENDSPEVLGSYGKSLGADFGRWAFCTGDPKEIMRLALASGVNFWQEKGAISHNLRTVVVGSDGLVRTVFEGNSWSPSALAQALLRAQ